MSGYTEYVVFGIFSAIVIAAMVFEIWRTEKLFKAVCERLKPRFPDAHVQKDDVEFTLHGFPAKIHWQEGNLRGFPRTPDITEFSVSFHSLPAIKDINRAQFQIHMKRRRNPTRDTFLDNVEINVRDNRMKDILLANDAFWDTLWNIYQVSRNLFGHYDMILLDDKGLLIQTMGVYIRKADAAVTFAEKAAEAFEMVRQMTAQLGAPVFDANKTSKLGVQTNDAGSPGLDEKIAAESWDGEFGNDSNLRTPENRRLERD